MEGNDTTIGRTNVSSNDDSTTNDIDAASTNENETTTVHQQPHNPLAAQQPPSTTTPAASFTWPTSYEYYELSNRIGQGAFASVWRARIKRQPKVDGDKNNEIYGNEEGTNNNEQRVECAIKIMDLEHVNINISGKKCIFLSLVDLAG